MELWRPMGGLSGAVGTWMGGVVGGEAGCGGDGGVGAGGGLVEGVDEGIELGGGVREADGVHEIVLSNGRDARAELGERAQAACDGDVERERGDGGCGEAD